MTAFDELFDSSARRIRARLASRIVLRYAGFGFLAAAVVAIGLWWYRAADASWSLAIAVVGALVGMAVARRQRWSDDDVALFLDSRLESKEAIATAVELRSNLNAPSEVRSAVTRDAAVALEADRERRVGPKRYDFSHWAGFLGLVCLAAAILAPARIGPKAMDSTGKDLVKRNVVTGLDRVTRLREVQLGDAQQRRKLEALADEAKKLQSALSQGLEKREALSRLAELQDRVRGERLSLSDPQNRAGLEAALGALESDANLNRAAQALGNGDVSAFDREMQRLANLAEKSARSAAKDLLARAHEAASRRGAHDAGKLFEEQQRLFEQRESRAEALREFARLLEGQLDERAREALEKFRQTGDPEAQRALAEALSDALGKLTDEERRKLAERLGELAQNQHDLEPMTREQLEKLARDLASDDGKQRLAEQLRQLAEQSPSDAARRDRALEDAERGAGEAQRDIGGVVPMPRSPQSGTSGPKNGAQQPGGKSGPSTDRGTHQPNGKTSPVETDSLKSKARATLNPAVPLQGATAGRAPARAGETANQRGVGSLGAAGPEQIQAVERSEIPAEYREQVGRYFEPR